MSTTSTQDAQQLLSRFGLASFRPGQLDVIEAVLAGEDCLCIMPTGGGKSLCYQLPAVMRPGVALVISPLIALMKDQVDALCRLNLRATYINSSLTPAEQADRIAGMQAGEYDLVYLAPERFRSPRFVEAVRQSSVQLLAVDEAHCISEWGHDFRPDYARLGWFRQQIGNPPTIALTATATPRVRDDVVKQLHLRKPRSFLAGFARPNLRFEVTSTRTAGEKPDVLTEFLQQTPGSGIIYTNARKRCDEIATAVAATGRTVGIYHAGMMPDERRRAQENFMRGKTEIVVATVAFGMGIDKADVRFVLHYNMPGSIEAYYQEAGRAGRDGQPSRCVLIYTTSDRYIQEYFIENAYPSADVVAEVYNYLKGLDDDPIELTQQEIKETLQLSVGSEGVGACLQLLQKAGAMERLEPLQNRAIVRLMSDAPTLLDFLPKTATSQRKVLASVERIVGQRRFEDVYFHPRQLSAATEMPSSALARALRELRKLEALDYVPPFRGRALRVLQPQRRFEELNIDFAAYERRKQAEYAKLDEMISYATTRKCRQWHILKYFGDPDGKPCTNCDRCAPAGGTSSTSTATPRNDRARANLVKTVRIALSGVARTEGRVGKQMIAQMLSGSRATKIAKLKLDQLSTFGLLKHLRQSDVQALLDGLIQNGLVEQVDVQRYRPVLKLTESGREVMTEKCELPELLHLPASVLDAVVSHDFDEPADRPSAARSIESDPGLPSANNILQQDREADAPSAAHRRIDAPVVQSLGEAPQRPDHYWTWRLLSAGFKAEECTEIRRISREDVFAQVSEAAEAGLGIDAGWLFSKPQLEALEAAQNAGRLDAHGIEMPNGQSEFSEAQIKLFLKCRGGPRSKRPATSR